MILPKKITIGIDTSEKKALPFPSTVQWCVPGGKPSLITVATKSVNLQKYGGDYMLMDAGPLVVVERKGSLDELKTNLMSGDVFRQRASFQKLLDATPNPYLVLDFPWTASLWYKGGIAGKKEELVDGVWLKLAQVTAEYSLRVLSLGTTGGQPARRRLSTFLLYIFLSHYLKGDRTDAKKA